MILLIRGHVRNAFDNPSLYVFLQMLVSIYDNDVKVYIHTMDITQNNLSWRDIPEILDNITETKIKDYFKELSKFIKYIKISKTEDIQLIGNTNYILTNHPISKQRTPLQNTNMLIGWKNMWWVINTILHEMYDNHKIRNNELIINTRFDIFSNINPCNLYSIFDLLERTHFSETYVKHNNTFITNNLCTGIDNIYIGNIYTMLELSFIFNNKLEEVVKKYPNIMNQEYYVYYANQDLVRSNRV
jgi:hypothetical protein